MSCRSGDAAALNERVSLKDDCIGSIFMTGIFGRP
jgi:hypothetical protein